MNLTREARGFVVRGRFDYPAKGDRPPVEHWAWWYGPDHGWGTTWGGLDYSVHVFASKAGARLALQRAGLQRRVEVVRVQDAVVLEIEDVKARRAGAVEAGRTDVAIACTATIAKLRKLQRAAA